MKVSDYVEEKAVETVDELFEQNHKKLNELEKRITQLLEDSAEKHSLKVSIRSMYGVFDKKRGTLEKVFWLSRSGDEYTASFSDIRLRATKSSLIVTVKMPLLHDERKSLKKTFRDTKKASKEERAFDFVESLVDKLFESMEFIDKKKVGDFLDAKEKEKEYRETLSHSMS